jgi:hypothetical protein
MLLCIHALFNQSNPLVPPGNLYYIAGSFGNPEIVKVVSREEHSS